MTYDIDLFYSGLKEVVSATRKAINARIGAGFVADIKQDGTFVTDVDRDAENAARSTILRLFPDHSIVGEEYEALDTGSEYTWYIDPIDGTQNLKHGVPTFGTVLALYHKQTPLVAAIDHPALNLCYMAAKGRGTTKNGVQVSIPNSNDAELDRQDIISFTPRYNFIRGGIDKIYQQVSELHPHFRVYYDCFAHSMAAQGSLAFAIDVDLRIWDFAAAALLVREAGGAFEFINEYSDENNNQKFNVLMGRSAVVKKYLPILQKLFVPN